MKKDDEQADGMGGNLLFNSSVFRLLLSRSLNGVMNRNQPLLMALRAPLVLRSPLRSVPSTKPRCFNKMSGVRLAN
jgi:hypothetical protein